MLVLMAPKSQKSQDIWIGKGGKWRDKTRMEYVYGTGWADLICWVPLGLFNMPSGGNQLCANPSEHGSSDGSRRSR